MVSHRSHRLSSFFFILISLFFSHWLISKSLSLISQILLFAFHGIFCFMHSSFLFLLMISSSLLNFSLRSYIVFLILLNCLCFLVACWIALKLLFWIISLVNYRSLRVWVWLQEAYCGLLVVSHYLDCFCSLNFCIVILTSESAVISSCPYCHLEGQEGLAFMHHYRIYN